MREFLPGEMIVLIVVGAGVLLGLAIVLGRAVRTYRAMRGTRVVRCPATGEPAAVEVDPLDAAVAAASGEEMLRIRKCTRWPEHAPCGQECLEQIAVAPAECLARTMLTRWYEDRPCTLCGKLFGELHWLDHRPAILDPNGKTIEWREVRAETLPDVLSTHRPVCWNCHVAETFRRQYPELVIEAWRAPEGRHDHAASMDRST